MRRNSCYASEAVHGFAGVGDSAPELIPGDWSGGSGRIIRLKCKLLTGASTNCTIYVRNDIAGTDKWTELASVTGAFDGDGIMSANVAIESPYAGPMYFYASCWGSAAAWTADLEVWVEVD